MAVFETWLRSDLKKPMRVVELSGNLFSADNGGNLIGVEVLDGGQAASLSGNVYGYVIRADGATVLVDGTLNGNRASIILPASAYLVIGQASIVIKVGTVTVGACVAQVYRTSTDTLVDPANVIPSISELLEAIDDCRQATDDANSAAALANTKAGLADEKATLADQKATLANTAAGTANTAAAVANAAAGKIDNMTVAANGLAPGSAPTVAISEVSGHKHILFGLVKGDKGKDFHIAKTFASIAAMMAYAGADIEAYDFAMIDTGSVQDPDTGKLYCYEPDKTPKWQYIGDLSGAQGIKGETGTGIDHIALNQDYTLTVYLDDNTSYTTASIRGATGETPDITIGTVTTLNYDQQAYVTLDPSSTPEDPVFNFGIPQGEPGSAENVYGNTVPMSTTDSTKVATAINAKLDANQGSANAGKFMRVGSTGAVAYDSPTERYSSLNDFPATGDEGKLYIAEDTGMMYVWDSEYVPVGGTSSDECEVSGDIVSFETFESKAKKLVVNIEPVQDLHGYDNPWPAGGGKNVVDPSIFPTTITGTSYVSIPVNASDIQKMKTEGASIKVEGTLGSGKTRYSIYSYTGTNNDALYINDSQFLTEENGFTLRGNISAIHLDDMTHLRIYAQPYEGSAETTITNVYFQIGNSGDWVPYENLCPISGWDSANVTGTGINIWDEKTRSGYYDSVTGEFKPQSSTLANKNMIPVMPNTTYYCKSGTYRVNTAYFDKYMHYISGGYHKENTAFTTPANCYFMGFSNDFGAGTTYNDDISINYPATDTQYHAYSGETAEYTFPSEAGTVYGGSLTIHQDGTGELVVDHFLYEYDGTETFSKSGTALNGFYNQLTGGTIPHNWPKMLDYNQASTYTDEKSSMFILTRNANTYKQNYGYCLIDSGHNFDVPPETFGTTVESFKAKLAELYAAGTPVSVFCKIATPVTYQLTNQQVVSLLKGQNVLWADCGSIDLTYYRTETAYQVSLNTADIAELQGEVEANSDAIEELQQDFTGATASADGAHGLVPAPEEGDQGKFLKGDGTWGNVPNPQVMTGATSSTAGVSGLVPAPAAGDQDKVLTGAGTWETPIGSRLYVVNLDAVSNTSGSYTHTTTVTGMTGDLKAVAIECSDPTIFHATVTITPATDSVTLACSDVAGSSTVKVSFLAVGNANPLSSTEYAALDARIGDLSDLTTTDKTSVVDAVNEVNGKSSETIVDNITLPYTADSDGIMSFECYPQTSNTVSYYTMTETSPGGDVSADYRPAGTSTNGTAYMVTAVLKKGYTYALANSSNVTRISPIRVMKF